MFNRSALCNRAKSSSLFVFNSFVIALLFFGSIANAQVTYSIGAETDLLDSSFYTGTAGGRAAFWGAMNNAGTEVVFAGIDYTGFNTGLYWVRVGDPSSWHFIYGTPFASPIYWTPDDSAVIVDSGKYELSNGNPVAFTFLDAVYFGYSMAHTEPSITAMDSNNWVIFDNSTNPHIMTALPVNPDGTPDTGRGPVTIADFTASGSLTGEINWPSVAPDGSAVVFVDYAGMPPGAPDTGDVYVLKNLQGILAGTISPPTTLSDPNIVAIRANETANIAHCPRFSQDGRLVLYGEDVNNTFNANDWFNSLVPGNWDIMVSAADGSGTDFQISQPGNQFFPICGRGGPRLTYVRSVGSPTSLHLFMTTFTVQTLVSGTTLGNPANNDIQTTAQQSAADGSGTVLSIPTGTLINFPTGAPQEIEIHTPIDPVTAPQLPPGVDAIPVVREFGPTGTQFVPAITVTITYLDQEIVGLNEANLNVFLYDDATGIYDLPVTVTVRDLVNNKISFQVDHFSKYGVGQGVLPDADGDGLSDDDETNLYGTNPNIPDSDGDGLQDAWEVWHLLDPLDDGSVNPDNGANGDPDHDGLTNEYEFAHGGDPQTYDAPITIPAVGFLGLVALTFLLGFVASRRIHRLGRTG